MANSAGVSGPFNPAIGLGGSQGPMIIGVSPANIPAAINGAYPWNQAALGDFIGIQSSNTTEYSDNPPSVDFDATFVVDVVTPAHAEGQMSYQAGPSGAPFYLFKTSAAGQAATVTMPGGTAAAGSPVTLTATVHDSTSAAVVGATVNFTIEGGSALAPALSVGSAVTNASGQATVNVTATGTGTVDVHAASGSAQPADATATFT